MNEVNGISEGRASEGSDARERESRVLNHRLIEEIGHGGMGTVHRARQDCLDREIAVKVVNPSFMSAWSMERFAREARVLALLDHPNIVPIYDYGIDESGQHAYAMKLVRGRTLEAILMAIRDGAEVRPLDRLLRVFRKVCDAVAFAHSRGIIHRDLKPANIMVGEFGEVLVMDWGVAGDIVRPSYGGVPVADGSPVPVATIPTGSGYDSGLTLEGEVLGTPQYMSPEQAVGSVELDERTDVYSLGGILYAILTLRAPLPDGDTHELIGMVRNGKIEPLLSDEEILRELKGTRRVPAALLAVVRKAMAPRLEDRFPTVAALAADIDAYMHGFATSAERAGVAGQLWLLIKRNRVFATAAAILFAISVAFVIRLMASENRANMNAETARANERAAKVAGMEAERAKGIAQENEAAAQAAAARARIMQADSAYAANDARQMRAALDAVPKELRDALWEYLNERTDDRQSFLQWNGDSFLIGSVAHPTKPGVFTVATSPKWSRIVDFDARSGEVLKSFSFGKGWVRAIAYSPDASRIAVGRIMEGGISIHDAKDGREILRWDTDWVETLEFLPDGVRLLRSRSDGCDLWDSTTGKKLWNLEDGWQHFLMPSGEEVMSVGSEVRFHAVADGRMLRSFTVKDATPKAAALSPDGTLLVLAHPDGQITGVRTTDGVQIFGTSAGDDGDIRRTAFMPDGQRIITVASLDESGQVIQILDAKTGRLLRRLRGGTGGVESLSIHPRSNDMLITCEGSATWALPTSREPKWSRESGILGGFLGGDDFYLGSTPEAPLGLVDLRSGVTKWRPQRALVNRASVDFGGTVAVAQSSKDIPDGRLFVAIEAKEGKLRQLSEIKFDTDPRVIAVNCDGTRVAVGAPWGKVGAFRTDSGKALAKLDFDTLDFTYGLAWHGRDPERLYGVFARHGRRGNPTSQEWLVAWNTATGHRIAGVQHPSALNCLATEPRGDRLAEGGDDKFVRIRDANSLAVLREFRAHDQPIHAMAWNPAFPVLATSSSDRSIRLWDVETGRMIEEVYIGLREASLLRFSPNGRRLAASMPGARTLIWEFPKLETDLNAVRKAGRR